jgi:hypothetical protein
MVPSKKPLKPTFLEGLIGSAVPLMAALLVAVIAFVLYYLFWFGFDALTGR